MTCTPQHVDRTYTTAVNASNWHAHMIAWISTVSATAGVGGSGGPLSEAYHATAAAAVMATANVAAAAVVDSDDALRDRSR